MNTGKNNRARKLKYYEEKGRGLCCASWGLMAEEEWPEEWTVDLTGVEELLEPVIQNDRFRSNMKLVL